jgi:hypothetical protein
MKLPDTNISVVFAFAFAGTKPAVGAISVAGYLRGGQWWYAIWNALSRIASSVYSSGWVGLSGSLIAC